jgi:hypothetical protein
MPPGGASSVISLFQPRAFVLVLDPRAMPSTRERGNSTM